MKMKIIIVTFLMAIGLAGCSKEYDCTDFPIVPAFVGFSRSDIDTIVLRKYKPNDNFQNLVDTFQIIDGKNGNYYTENDTTTVQVSDEKNGIKAGFDWLLFVPAKNRVIVISDIVSEKRTGKCGSGIFSMDKFGCLCENKVFSVKNGNQIIDFSNTDQAGYFIFIRN